MNYTVAGKHVEKDFKCPICFAILEPQELRTHMDHETLGLGGGCITYFPVYCETSVNFRCMSCGTRVELSIPDHARLRVDSEPTKPKEWEYFVMAINSVKYGRVKNLGDYETERMEAEYVLEAGETAEQGLAEVKRFVKTQLGLGPSEDELEAARQLLAEMGEL